MNGEIWSFILRRDKRSSKSFRAGDSDTEDDCGTASTAPTIKDEIEVCIDEVAASRARLEQYDVSIAEKEAEIVELEAKVRDLRGVIGQKRKCRDAERTIYEQWCTRLHDLQRVPLQPKSLVTDEVPRPLSVSASPGTQEIIEIINARPVKLLQCKVFEWECSASHEHFTREEIEERAAWSDAAYYGHWSALFKIAYHQPHNMGRLINSKRLYSEGDLMKGSLPGYTALHQAAYHGARVEIVAALINLGASLWVRTAKRKQRPIDIAREKGFTALYHLLEPPRGLPHVSDEQLQNVETHFWEVIKPASLETFDTTTMYLPELGILRELAPNAVVNVPIPEMRGYLTYTWETDHLRTVTTSATLGNQRLTYYITPAGVNLICYRS